MEAVIWLVLMVVFLAAEAATVSMVSLWFAAGSLVALAVSLLGGPIWLQVVLFLAVSAAALAMTRPLLRRITTAKATPTNADRVLGSLVKVTETIDNENSTGAVYADGKTWTARSVDGTVFPAGSQVRVEAMEGVKLLVNQPEKPAQAEKLEV